MKPRQLIIKEDYALVPLTQGEFAIIDLEDIDKVKNYNWHLTKNITGIYACRTINKSKQNNKVQLIRLHNIINPPPENMLNDHKDLNGLNNRKSNLRFCTLQQNSMNRQKRKNCTSVFKGVSWRKDRNKWNVSIKTYCKKIYLGTYENEIDAAMAYDKAAIEYYSKFALTNKMLNLIQ